MSRFCVDVLLSHSAKKIRIGTLLICVSENFWYRKTLWIRGGGGSVTVFCQVFCLTLLKNFVEEPFWSVFQKNSGSGKTFMDKSGGITVLSKSFVSQDRNEEFGEGTLLFSRKFLVSKKVVNKRGHITIFGRFFYVSLCQKDAKVNPTVFFSKNFWFRKVLWFKDG